MHKINVHTYKIGMDIFILGSDIVQIEYEEDVMTVKLSGDLDHHRCSDLRKKIDAKAEMQRPKLLRLDFEDVVFSDSSGVGLVMGRYRQMLLLGGKLEVVNLSQYLKKVFRLSGLEVLGVIK